MHNTKRSIGRWAWTGVAVCLMCVWPASSRLYAQNAVPGQSFGFDYSIQAFTDAAVVRFEMQIDAGAWADIQVPPTADDANTATGAHTYKVSIPALTPGAHTVAFRACNASACSASSGAFNFTLIVFSPPSNVRIVGD